MDRRINYLIGLDTETANGILVEDKLDLSQSLVYDLGWVVTDRHGRIYEKKSFVVREIFIGMKDVMKSAYYAERFRNIGKKSEAEVESLLIFRQLEESF